MAVRKRKDTKKWEVDIKLGIRRVRVTSPVQTKRGAKEYEIKLRQEHLDSLTSTQSSKQQASIEEFAVEWLKTYVAVNNKPSTLADKESILRLHLLPYFRKLMLDEVTTLMVEKYKASKVAALTQKSINNHLTILRKMLTTAEEWGYEAQVPVIKWFPNRSGRVCFLESAQSRQFLKCVDPEWYPMIFTALNTGMRQGELAGLKWSDVDFKQNSLTVARSVWKGILGLPKNGRTRIIPMNKPLAKVLRDLRARQLPGDFVFCKKNGNMLKYTEVRWPIWRACDKAGMDRFQWHMLRHTFASQLVMAGAGITQVKELLGHQTLEMTMRYAHLAPSALAETVDLLVQDDGKEEAEPALKIVADSA